MVSAPPAPASEAYTFSRTPEPTLTEEPAMKLAAQPPAETPLPQPLVDGTAAAALPAEGGRGSGAPEATPEVAGQDMSVHDRGEVRTPLWAQEWVWRAWPAWDSEGKPFPEPGSATPIRLVAGLF